MAFFIIHSVIQASSRRRREADRQYLYSKYGDDDYYPLPTKQPEEKTTKGDVAFAVLLIVGFIVGACLATIAPH